VLVTNDDGVDSPGLHALASAASEAGHSVVVAAPLRDHSGFGAAVGPLHVTGQIVIERRRVPGLPDAMEVIGVDGPPALCVLAACLEGFGPRPDVVLSGINLGANLGRAVLHSGTVGAALTANNFGIPGIAVSQAHGESQHWSTAAEVAVELLDWLAAAAPAPLTLNVNVPNVAVRPPAAHVAMLELGGQVQSRVVEAARGVLTLEVEAAGGPVPGTDAAVLADGCIAVTPLGGVHAVEVDIVDAVARLAAPAVRDVA